MTQCGRFSDQTDLVATAVIPEPVDNRPYGDRAHVLAQTDAQSALQRVPTAVCCPKCGEAVTLYERGLPETVPYFETTCQQCDVDLRAWCAVAVDTAYLQVVKPSTLTAMVQRFWDTWLWSGITNSKGEPRNDEYRDRLTTKAATFGWGWEVSCPLCRRPLTKLGRVSAIVNGNLDYHHWSHEPDRGICLCRECHDIIGFDTYDTKLEERAASWGFDSRHDLQIVRLALRDAAVTNRSAGPQYASELVDRYNLPQSAARIQELLRAINAEEQLRERFVDERLVDGIEN
jgi:hypothetical protein